MRTYSFSSWPAMSTAMKVPVLPTPPVQCITILCFSPLFTCRKRDQRNGKKIESIKEEEIKGERGGESDRIL